MRHCAHGVLGAMTASLELIRVRGQVQGVGFRPTVSRLAVQLGLPGWVRNDADGVLIALYGDASLRQRFVQSLLADLPPLAQVRELVRDSAEISLERLQVPRAGFSIVRSSALHPLPRAQVVPDAALCAACAAEVLDRGARRFRYPFTNCTHCGPRFSIARALPWDRANTSMAGFALCATCQAEYEEPAHRRYHAEPIACGCCGPRAHLTRADGTPFDLRALEASDVMHTVTRLLLSGSIVAIKGLGGYQLLADATRTEVVERLRSRKRRPDKPFALMARDLTIVEAYCEVSPEERDALLAPSSPIVLLQRRAQMSARPLSDALLRLPPGAAARYGFMLPTTPLHLLVLQGVDRPVICTSGNRSDEPQVIDDSEVHARLGDIADWVLSHERPIHNRVDDSVVRVFAGRLRVLRRARGLAPAPLPLPPGFEAVAARESVFAAGADLKATVCLSRAHDVVLSQHLGDLDDTLSFAAFAEQSQRLCALFEHQPTRVAVDNHPDSRAARHAAQLAHTRGLPLQQVSHHHAHFAACLGENGVALTSAPLFGLVLDGIGLGADGHSLWGCELFCGGYGSVVRLGTLLPTALYGGDRAAREPWRCLYAQLKAAAPQEQEPWLALCPQLRASGLPGALAALRDEPLRLLDQLQAGPLAAPCASSCGRLFDAVAAALSICFERQSFEAQAAQGLEALVTPELLAQAVAERAYSLAVKTSHALTLNPRPHWAPLPADLARGTQPGLIAAHFHVALAAGLAHVCAAAAANCERSGQHVLRAVALSGGCLQNAVLHERLESELTQRGFKVLSHAEVPANDAGIAFGQALITLALQAHTPTER